MRRPNQTLRQVYAVGSTLLCCLIGACSGRQVTHELSESEVALLSRPRGTGAAGNSNVTVQNSGTLGLTSEPASVTRLNSLITSVKTSLGASYRFSLAHSDHEDCTTWSDFRTPDEPLKLALGSDGPKTLCVQEREKSGKVSEAVVYKFVKDSASSEPEYKLSGKPTRFTSQSSARIMIDSAEAFEYRMQFLNSSECGTLENTPWTPVTQAIETQFRFDGTWSLCLQVRDAQGNMSKKIDQHMWTRDTVYPVLDDLDIPDGPLQKDELTLIIKGSQVFEYQFALLDESGDCKNANYSDFIAASEPLKIKLSENGIKTLCVLSRSEGGLMQQAPFVQLLQKMNLQAQVKAVPVEASANESTPKQFIISGAAITHYKALSFDFSTSCEDRAVPSSNAKPVSETLGLSLSGSGIKTLCVWGISQSGSETSVVQNAPTYFRFFNDRSDYSFVYENNLEPFTLKEAANTCAKCHNNYTTAAGFQNNSVNIAARLRYQNQARPMPPSGWSMDEKRKRMMLFLYSLPGYPQDLPQKK